MAKKAWPTKEVITASKKVVCLAIHRFHQADPWAIRFDVMGYPQFRFVDGWGQPLKHKIHITRHKDDIKNAMLEAARILQEHPPQEPQTKEDPIARLKALRENPTDPKLLEQAIHGNNDYVREAAINLLAESNLPNRGKLISGVIKKVLNKDSGWNNPNNMLCCAAKAAGRTRDRGLIPALEQILIHESDRNSATRYAKESIKALKRKLVWSDEFEKHGAPDHTKWDYELGFVRNREAQYYTKENVRVEKGCLIIEARKNENHDLAKYTSASLITKNKASWLYGRVEVRAKLPRGRGMWPAIWMLGANISKKGWPACGEIDIMEYVGYDPNTIYANVHTQKYNHVKKTGKGSKIRINDPCDSFHVYAMEWTPEKIDFFVDDKRYFTFKNEGTGQDVWPFDLPHYLILNVAVGGAWGGAKGIDETIFPQSMEVDYVRVYEDES